MKKIILTAIMSALVVSAPLYGISARRHPNLARAQKEVAAAFNSISAAQRANEFDLAGHAAKAKELLEQANRELKQAAEQANDNKGH